jgi:hypothetical protein
VALDFQQLRLAAEPAPSLAGFSFTGQGKGGTLLSAQAQAQGLSLTLKPLTPIRRSLAVQAQDAGTLLQALDAYQALHGGELTLEEEYGGATPATGKLTLVKFRLLKAPAFTRVMQALTVYGVPEATSGPGLLFDRAIVPFSISEDILRLQNARAYSASLGFTASGTIGLDDNTADIDATIIPAYALNTLPGKIPLIGHLFTAEKGGGLISVRAKIKGNLDDPEVAVNPLSAFTPGVFRDLFGLGGAPKINNP